MAKDKTNFKNILSIKFNVISQDDNTVLPRNLVPLNGLKRPFRREGNSVVKPFRNFATGLIDKDKLWLLLPWCSPKVQQVADENN
ncbi:hypothetical protein ACTXT7_016019 [Hymenolepis weldensis]